MRPWIGPVGASGWIFPPPARRSAARRNREPFRRRAPGSVRRRKKKCAAGSWQIRRTVATLRSRRRQPNLCARHCCERREFRPWRSRNRLALRQRLGRAAKRAGAEAHSISRFRARIPGRSRPVLRRSATFAIPLTFSMKVLLRRLYRRKFPLSAGNCHQFPWTISMPRQPGQKSISP